MPPLEKTPAGHGWRPILLFDAPWDLSWWERVGTAALAKLLRVRELDTYLRKLRP